MAPCPDNEPEPGFLLHVNLLKRRSSMREAQQFGEGAGEAEGSLLDLSVWKELSSQLILLVKTKI